MLWFFKRHFPVLLLLGFLVVISYANGLTADFVSDDIAAIPQNQAIKNFDFIFSAPPYFVRTLTHFIAYAIGGPNVVIFRLFNIVFHMVNVFLVFAIIYFLTKKENVSFFTAALFAVHPILIESVTWISGGAYSQYTFFVLLSFLLYIKVSGKRSGYIATFLAFLLALCTTEKAGVIPIIFLVYELSLGNLKRNWKRLAPFFLIALVFAFVFLVLRLGERVSFLQSQTSEPRGFDNPIFQVPIAVVSYLWLMIWPDKLTIYHSELRFTFDQYFVYLFFFVIFIGTIVFSYVKNKMIFFWLSFFIISLLPTLMPFRLSWIVAERYVYLGALGVFFTCAYLFVLMMQKAKVKHLEYFIFFPILFILVVRTFFRNIDWKNQDNLWIATIKTSPSSPVAHNNLADVYYRHRDFNKAEKELKKAIEINPSYAEAYHNLGNLYRDTQKVDLALESYQKAVSLNPAIWQSYLNIAAIFFDQKKFSDALIYMKKAVKLSPNNPAIYRNLGIVYFNLGQKKEASAQFYKALQLAPNDTLTKAWIFEVSK